MDRKELLEKLSDSLRATVAEVTHTMAWSEVNFSGSEEIKSFSFGSSCAGLIGVRGALNGQVAVTADEQLAKNLVSRIAGISPDDVTPEDLIDGMSELANMICGGMKTKLAMGHLDLSAPLAVVGCTYLAHWKTDHSTLLLNFQVEGHILRVYACL